ncbi:MAG: hypothetical protein H0X26_09415 [Alphaproteobacteria bacterium]|nr:hypothetical protein [Alphaproteobacteria bacterium]
MSTYPKNFGEFVEWFPDDAACYTYFFKPLEELSVRRKGNLILIKTRARSFLHNQVRNMVGTLKRVGEGSWPPSKVKEILEARDRRVAGPTAPACGLYLTGVKFSLE